MVNVQIYYGDTQVWPETLGESFAADDETVSFPEYYRIPYKDYEFRAKLWSPGTSYNHKITIRMGILPEWAVRTVMLIQKLVDALYGLTSFLRLRRT